jgi:RNA polymerase sigma-70 factor, ECF subfamily
VRSVVTPAVVESSVVRELEGLRGQILAYCYRMLGSPHDAEDAVQETMVRAWRSLERLEDPSGLRPWVYRIATNVCIDASTHGRRRALPMDLAGPNDGLDKLGSPLPESVWVEPIPSRLVGADDPLERTVSRETIRLAFVAALQHLLPRQRAVLILRDVLRWRAAEVAELLETSVDAVNSTLRRARRALMEARGAETPRQVDDAVDVRLLESYVDAFERFDVERIVALLHRDVVVSMPPFSFWLRGRETFRVWLESGGPGCQHARPEITEANGCPAVALFRLGADGALAPGAIHVLEWHRGQVSYLHAFLDPSLFSLFGLVVPTGAAGRG